VPSQVDRSGVSKRALRPLLGDLRQFASVRRIVLDDGAERGVRALAFSTGGGLDFWVMSDRSLDIGPLWCHGVPVAWQSPTGYQSPALHDAEGDKGRGFNRSFSGFLVTCGLDHVRQPANGHPLHGRLPFTPARLLAYGEDWDRPEPILFCEGEVTQARYGGESLRLRRRIEAPIGAREIRIEDTVENLGAQVCQHAMLYHFNLGYPAVAVGTEVRLGSQSVLGPIMLPDPADSREAVSYPSPEGAQALCTVSTPTLDDTHFAVEFRTGADTLPYFQIWRDLRPNAGVLAVEPCTSERRVDGQSGLERTLMPGERRHYALRIRMSGMPTPTGQTEPYAAAGE
jgi:hypothetical protein